MVSKPRGWQIAGNHLSGMPQMRFKLARVNSQPNMKPIHIGTSGWIYKSWREAFYPEDIPAREHLDFYTTQFPTVEINATFYRLPPLSAVKNWHARAPRNFLFAVKGSRFITHMKKLVNLGGGLNRFIRRVRPLKEHLGPILWQLPPNLGFDPDRLDRFLGKLPKSLRHAVEFRHRSWYEDEDTFAILRRHNMAHVALSTLNMPPDFTVTSDFIYIRFHGLAGGFAHDYTREELEPWAEHIRKQSRADCTVFAYFNNDMNVRAPANARMLMEMVRAAKPRNARSLAQVMSQT